MKNLIRIVTSLVVAFAAAFGTSRLRITLLCGEVIAPTWLSQGREWKYSSLSCSGIFSIIPVMRTWRSSSFQKKIRQAFGFSAISTDFALP